MVALPEVWSVPALVLRTPTPKPPVKYPEPPTARAAPTDGVVVAIARRVDMYCWPETSKMLFAVDVASVPTNTTLAVSSG